MMRKILMMKISTTFLETGKKVLREVIFWGGIILLFVSFLVLGQKHQEQTAEDDRVRTEEICPALLSISRSARDTLIVMKAEPLCNSFVLDNLK